MENVCPNDMCAGCMACIDVCPKNAIKIVDGVRSYNAVIDEKLCVDCNACRKVCQNNSASELKKPISWYQGWANEQDIRANSSSGGIAAELSRSFIENHGSVVSCVFKNGKFGFEFADSADDTKKFVGSKYVKSNPEGIYKRIKQKLDNGEKVLFIGLPCQAAAVINYVGAKAAENLFTVDLICHGSPSPKLLDKFLSCHKNSLKNMDVIAFRKKGHFHVYDKQNGILPERIQDSYTYAFLNCVIYTENCYKCKYARVERISDITIGDSWGNELSAEEQKKGVSLILCQTDKGAKLFDQASIHLESVVSDKAVAANRQLRAPSEKPEIREKFFKSIENGAGFESAFRKCYPKIYYKQKLKLLLIRMNILK